MFSSCQNLKEIWPFDLICIWIWSIFSGHSTFKIYKNRIFQKYVFIHVSYLKFIVESVSENAFYRLCAVIELKCILLDLGVNHFVFSSFCCCF